MAERLLSKAATPVLWVYGLDEELIGQFELWTDPSNWDRQYPVLKAGTDRIHAGGRLVMMGGQAVTLDRLGWVVRHGTQNLRYYPYGEEMGGATVQNRAKFATYTRDEDGSDYAWNRQYGTVTGRFTTPDPYAGSASAFRPDSWNRYSYVVNDPIGYTDSTGLQTSRSSPYGDSARSVVSPLVNSVDKVQETSSQPPSSPLTDSRVDTDSRRGPRKDRAERFENTVSRSGVNQSVGPVGDSTPDAAEIGSPRASSLTDLTEEVINGQIQMGPPPELASDEKGKTNSGCAERVRAKVEQDFRLFVTQQNARVQQALEYGAWGGFVPGLLVGGTEIGLPSGFVAGIAGAVVGAVGAATTQIFVIDPYEIFKGYFVTKQFNADFMVKTQCATP